MSDYRRFTTRHDLTCHWTHLLTPERRHEMKEAVETIGKTCLPENFDRAFDGLDARLADASGADTFLTLLVDMSGSMHGQGIRSGIIESLRQVGDRLDAAGIDFEILGFTTRNWKGGRSREDWIMAGRPKEPGRLNDLLHIVLKGADEPWAENRDAPMILAEFNLPKENIDGEALEWALERILQQPHARRAILVVSDGYPLDDSTLQANAPDCLRRHLRKIVDEVTREEGVTLGAVNLFFSAAEAERQRMDADYPRGVSVAHDDPAAFALALSERIATLALPAPALAEAPAP
ncbi:cobaltochelatase CobT-related protein [Defluviimonas salinarum]|uniref:Cobalamin biosynthesis protein CobT VWA domain-containing protein n=1 Tax=Defluviimonas salinarum TaxID=2992147 RepID=A0ABT3J5Q6_9RHOB|nr:hypothetical protein [Defluviimonas salinarum]MCW3782996.1 hypothetical protein [Defluviimonas salinarum]